MKSFVFFGRNPTLTSSPTGTRKALLPSARTVPLLGVEFCPYVLETVAFESQRDSAPKPKGWEARPTLGKMFKKHFQPRWGCFAQGHKTQGRPAAVAVGQPWAGGRNPVGIKGNETTLRIAYSWAKHSPRQRVRDGWTLIGTGAIQGIATRPARSPISETHSTRARHPRGAPSASGRACGPRLRIAPPGSGSGSSRPRDGKDPS